MQRRNEAFQVRQQAAVAQHQLPVVPHPTNGDDDRYHNKIASYTKGLPHNQLGEVDLSAYDRLIKALDSERAGDFDAIPLGCQDPTRRKLVCPQAGAAFDLEATDCQQLFMPSAPAFNSAERAAEAVELYWMALTRDVPFHSYVSDPTALAAADELSGLTKFTGPKQNGSVRADTLFRGATPGDLTGPYISQFLFKPARFGVQELSQKFAIYAQGIEFMTTYDDWLAIQNGCGPTASRQFGPTRYILTGRDLATYVHTDVSYQAYLNACLILLGMGAPLNPGNPYRSSQTQVGHSTFGTPHIMTLVAEVATRALKAVWFQKWYVHRLLRPETFGGRLHNVMVNGAGYPIHAQVLTSYAVKEVGKRNGTYLLPQAYPEGSPTHPSYAAGHAAIAGACATILKAFFDETFIIPNPEIPSEEGSTLVPYNGQLTVGGELNKLAANISNGRNFAGIHWRKDFVEGAKLGEDVAISLLRDQRYTFNEPFSGFTFTKFDGTQITV
ncbi:MAG: vanadium-dependent haloperoxidase [Nitrospira sp.]|nr:vanadium-dependent haloperoxidase [Nitrospira sp.]